MYLFLDTETTGTNVTRDRIVQIAWIVANEDGNVVLEKKYTIEPVGFYIPAAAAQIHGITTERAIRDGCSLEEVLEELVEDADDAVSVIAHNAAFDLAILRREFDRCGHDYTFEGIKPICTMRSSVAYCRLPKLNGGTGYKWPKLDELYYNLFGEYFDGSHDALSDTRACMRCFFELIDLGVISAFRPHRNGSRPSEKHYEPTGQMLAKEIEELRNALDAERLKTVQLQERIDYLESEDGLFSLALCSNDADWLVAVAGHPTATPEVIDEVRELAEFYDRGRIYCAIAGNPASPSELIHELVLSQDYDGRGLFEAAVSNPSTSGETLYEICLFSDFSLYSVAVNNPSFSENEFYNFLEDKIQTGEDEYKLWISQFESCPNDLLLRLSEDDSPRLREAVASNKNCPVAALSHLSFDEIQSVRRAAEANPKHVFQQLKKAIAFGDLDTVVKIINEEEMEAIQFVAECVGPPSGYDEVANYPLRQIRLGLAAYVKTHPDILDSLSKCSDARLREEVALNEKCPSIVLDRLANDSEIRVRIAAKHRIKAR